MTTLITGARGFVGSHLLARVAGAHALTRENADLTAPLPRLPHVEAVIHCAAEMDDPYRMRAVNVDGTRRLIDWAVSTGARTFILLSTGGIHAATPYAESKREAEGVAAAAAGALSVRIVRLFFPYGPGQRSRRLVPRLVASVRAGEPVGRNDDGGPRLSLTSIDDVVDGLVAVASAQGSGTVDLGGPGVSMQALAETIGKLAGREPQFLTNPVPAADLVADPVPLREWTGFAPRVALEEGLRACV